MQFSKIFSRINFGIFSLLVLILPAKVGAKCTAAGNIPGLPCLSDKPATGSLADYLGKVRDYLLGFVGILSVVFIIWGGVLYVTSAGNEERVKTAKATLTYAILGLVVAILAEVILSLIMGGFVSQIFTGASPY